MRIRIDLKAPRAELVCANFPRRLWLASLGPESFNSSRKSVTRVCYTSLLRKSVMRLCTKVCHEGLSQKSLAKVPPFNHPTAAHSPICLLPTYLSTSYLTSHPLTYKRHLSAHPLPNISQHTSLPTHLITYLLTSLLAQLLPTHTLFVLLTHPFLIPLQTFSNAHARMTSSPSLRRLSLGAHATCH